MEASGSAARHSSSHLPARFGEPIACMLRVQQAINAHDLEALTACFSVDYRSEFPAHPDRAFSGHEQLRANWSQLFGLVPDIRAELLRAVEDGETVWTEWEWSGNWTNHAPFLQRGVTLQGVRDGRIVWVRLYIEPVQAGGHDISDMPNGAM